MRFGSRTYNCIILLVLTLVMADITSAGIFGRKSKSHSHDKAIAAKNSLAFPEETPVLAKKPLTVAPQYTYQTIHEFENTPFINFDEFCSGIIGESNGVTFQEINQFNEQIRPLLSKIVHENFFKIFKLNLYKECPFWDDSNGFCMHKSCAVDTIDDWKDLPEIWQPEFLGKIESLSNNSVDVPNIDTDDTCIDDNIANKKDYCEIDEENEDTVFVNLVDNPERFTGYGGDQSFQIWKSIYNENCFNSQEQSQCIEKNFFYKLISGMHSSISTHLTNDYLNLKTKEYGPNLKQFMFRVGDFPERFENLYLNYILILKSLVKLSKHDIINNLKFCDEEFFNKEVELKEEMNTLIHSFDSVINKNKKDQDYLFDEDAFFQDENSVEIKDEFREKFKNVTRIMDCVHCDRCRLWGKVQTMGYGTALKTLFELDHNQLEIESSDSTEFEISKFELIALINTFDRLSKSIVSINNFKKLYDEAMIKEESIHTDDSDSDSDEHDMGTAFFGGKPSSLEEDIVVPPLVEEKKQEKLVATSDTPVTATKGNKLDKQDFPFPDPANPEIKYPSKNGPSIFGDFFGDFEFPTMDNFWTEVGVVKEAVYLVLKSYFIFPKMVYNWILVSIVYYWNKFVGVVVHDFDANRLYRIEL